MDWLQAIVAGALLLLGIVFWTAAALGSLHYFVVAAYEKRLTVSDGVVLGFVAALLLLAIWRGCL